MRFFLIVCISLLSSCLIVAQHSAAGYYSISGKIGSEDTLGLYSKIFLQEKKGTDNFYSLLLKGDYLLDKGNSKDAFNKYTAALDQLNNRTGDSLYALVNYKIGSIHYLNFNYPEALKYFNRSSLIYNYDPQNPQQAKLYIYIGNIHIGLVSNDQSIKCFKAALAFYKRINDLKKIAQTQNNIAIVYTEKKDFINAEKYLDSSLAIRKKLNDFHGIGQCHNNIGAMYYKKEEYKKALMHYKTGYENRIAGKVPHPGLIESQVNIGKSYFKMKDKENAIYWLEQGLAEAKSIEHFELQKRTAEQLKDLYHEMKNFSKAYELQELYFRIKDSLYGMDKKNMVENLTLQNQFESKIRQDSISNFEKIRSEKIVAGEKEKRNSILFLVLFTGIIFLSVFVFQLYKANALKKKTNAIILLQRDALDQKQKEIIDSINYAKRIQESLLPSDKYIARNWDRLRKNKKE